MAGRRLVSAVRRSDTSLVCNWSGSVAGRRLVSADPPTLGYKFGLQLVWQCGQDVDLSRQTLPPSGTSLVCSWSGSVAGRRLVSADPPSGTSLVCSWSGSVAGRRLVSAHPPSGTSLVCSWSGSEAGRRLVSAVRRSDTRSLFAWTFSKRDHSCCFLVS